MGLLCQSAAGLPQSQHSQDSPQPFLQQIGRWPTACLTLGRGLCALHLGAETPRVPSEYSCGLEQWLCSELQLLCWQDPGRQKLLCSSSSGPPGLTVMSARDSHQ